MILFFICSWMDVHVLHHFIAFLSIDVNLSKVWLSTISCLVNHCIFRAKLALWGSLWSLILGSTTILFFPSRVNFMRVTFLLIYDQLILIYPRQQFSLFYSNLQQLICIFFYFFRRGRWWGRGRGGRRWLNKLFLFCCHPTSSFRTTYTKYATSSSSLLSKNKNKYKTKKRKQKKIRLRKKSTKEKNPNLRKPRREMPGPILYDSEHQL